MLILISTAISWITAILLYKSSIASLGYDHPDPIPSTALSNQQRIASNSADARGVFSFVQISDLHISVFRHSEGVDHLKSFLSVELPILSPEKVIVTGDLTDAKSRWKLSSSQFDQEWHDYHDALLQAGVFSVQDFWLDQRGNHDCFDVAGFDHPSNYYKLFSSVKKEGYAIHTRKDYGTYSFIGVDGCPKYGTRRPFNFFGYLDEPDMNFLQESMLETANHTFIMSHYPSGTLIKGLSSKGTNFESLASHVSVWFSGHLHNLIGGLGETMYHRQKSGFLELELGDMKVNKMYRIVAVDNDVIAFRDLTLSQKTQDTIDPIVLITYPKDGRFLAKKEPRTVLSKDSFIRFLVWTGKKNEKIDFVISIDGIIKSNLKATYSGVGIPWKDQRISPEEPYTPLWTVQWDPSEYNDGLQHTITVEVNYDANPSSLSAVHTVVFRYDGEVIDDLDAGSGGFIISIDFNTFFKFLFVCGYIILYFGLLVLPKLWVTFLKQKRSYRAWKTNISKWILKSELKKKKYTDLFQRIISRWILRLCNLASDHPRLWTMYFIYSNMIICLPWFLGDFVPSSHDSSKRWGFSFVYGILFLDGTWIPLIDSWAYSTFTLFGTIIPFYLYFSCWYEPLEALFSAENVSRIRPVHRRWYVSLFIAYLWLYSALDAFFMIFYYGTWAVLINQRTWFLLFIARNLIIAWKNTEFSLVNNSVEYEASESGVSLNRNQSKSNNSYNLRSRSSINMN